GHATQLHLTLFVDFRLAHCRDETAECHLSGDASSRTRGQSTAPTRFLRGHLDHCLQTRRPVQERQAEGDRVLARLVGQLVNEAFDGEDIVIGTDSSPETCRYRG